MIEITTTKPAVIPAADALTLDHLWIELFSVNGRKLDLEPTPAIIVCRPYAIVDEYGTRVYGDDSTLRRITLADVFSAAAANQTLADALTTVLAAVQVLITQQDNPPASSSSSSSS
jgi:hypothetical protein